LTIFLLIGLAMARTFNQYLVAYFIVGIVFSGFGAQKHAFTVELVGLKLQPDYIVIDNSCGVPVLLLVGNYGLKIGKWFGFSNPSFILWICAVMTAVNFAITIYLHKIVEVKRKSRKISEKAQELADDSRIRYISECLTDTNASLARLAE